MSYDAAGRPSAIEIRLKSAEKMLEIDFENGVRCSFPAEFLRVESPSAEVKGHGPDQRVTVPGRRHVAITGIDPVGNYAVRLHFDDLHDTGLYSWEYLYELGEKQDDLWQKYLAELTRLGLSREP
jgi:DUF971 family protein